MLVADLYELTMAIGYYRRGMVEPATFSLFPRKLPPRRGFLVAAGIDEAVDRVTAWTIPDDDLDWVRRELNWPADLVEPLRGRRFTGEVWAVPEGSVVLADEPFLEVTAPLPEAQLVETTVLNAVTYQTVLATKALRCQIAAKWRPVVDFSLRRTHGIEAGAAAARAGGLAGFVATSNIGAAQEYGLHPTGTMAHSFVQAFPDERAAFAAFAEDFPAAPTFLVDTYDTAAAMAHAISVIRDQGLERRAAVRLDSGDLAAEARLARRMLDEAGLPDVRVVVSGGVDEYVIDDLVTGNAPVDAFAVGTRVGTSADGPLVDTAYKLVEYAGRPITKLSAGKSYPPGPKQVWRRPGHADVLATRDEPGPPGARAMLRPVVADGRRLQPAASVEQARQQLEDDLAWLPEEALGIRDPVPAQCQLSSNLQALRERVVAAHSRKAREREAT